MDNKVRRNKKSSDYSPSTSKIHEPLKSPEPEIALEAKLIRPYDFSPRLRQQHDKYMDEYREYLTKNCSSGNEFSKKNKKIIVDEYVRLTVKDDYFLKPHKAYRLITQGLIALLKQGFKFEPIPLLPDLIQIACSELACRMVIEIGEDDLVNTIKFYCIGCYRERVKGLLVKDEPKPKTLEQEMGEWKKKKDVLEKMEKGEKILEPSTKKKCCFDCKCVKRHCLTKIDCGDTHAYFFYVCDKCGRMGERFYGFD